MCRPPSPLYLAHPTQPSASTVKDVSMWQEHPDTVFNTRGEREDSLRRSSLEMIATFEALLAFLVQPAASAVRC